MELTREEQYWLCDRWPLLRNMVRSVMMRHCAPVVSKVIADGVIDDVTWKSYLASVLTEFHAKRSGRSDLCDAALDLLGDDTILRGAIEKARKDLTDDDSGVLFSMIIKRALTRTRNLRIASTEHIGKTWGKLDSVSRVLARRESEKAIQPVDRCTVEHFIDLVSHIREAYPNDHNLPRTVSGVAAYFYAHCPECAEAPFDENASSESASLPDNDRQGEHLEICLGELEGAERDFVLVKYQMSNPIELSVLSYCARNSIERTYFGRVVKRGIEHLRLCVEGRMESDFDGPDGFRSVWN